MGRRSGLLTALFLFEASVIMAPREVSLPVPDVVGMAMKGGVLAVSIFLSGAPT